MAEVSRDDAGSLEMLYARHSGAVFGLCLRILGDRGEAEELLEEIFWQLWQHRRRYDAERATPLTYLMTLTRSRAIDRLRFRRRRAAVWCEASADESSLDRFLVASEPDPLASVLAYERRAKLNAGLEQLSEAHRRAITLAFFGGLTHQEIAERLNEPLGTIKTRIRRGLLALRSILESLPELEPWEPR
ncbi:MAG: sigma-70 family RNA polymerase sigma factor [Myxococcales bacterium]|nr:sigma-70 family RNA polymerase sigma factor [Myxococcales bacterium]